MNLHLSLEVEHNMNIWFARIPTEANLSDLQSRCTGHPRLTSDKDVSQMANVNLKRFIDASACALNNLAQRGGGGQLSPTRKRDSVSMLELCPLDST